VIIILLGLFEKSMLKIINARYYLVLVIAFGIFTILWGANNIEARTMDNEWDYSSELVDIYASGDQILDSLEIPKEAKLMVLGPQYPNLPLILFNRKGYTLFSKKDWEIKRALTWDFDYIILPNQYFLKEFYSINPDLINRFEKIFDNGKFSICTLKETPSKTSLGDFFKLKEDDIVFQINEDFEQKKISSFDEIYFSDKYSFQGNSSGLIKGSHQFALNYINNSLKNLEDFPNKLRIKSKFLVLDTLKRVEFIVSIQDNNGNNQFYETFHLNHIYTGPNKWHNLELIYQLPRLIHDQYLFKMYYWNRDKSELFIDDLKYTFYR
jgi:hypothetical protein